MAKPETRPATILVADESEANRDLLTELLRAQGYRVICAQDGEEALEVLLRQPIDLALVDVAGGTAGW